jgi:multidrug resistance efflux pump
VRANTDGVVTKRDVEPGDLATPTRVLILLGDPARIRITATVDERDITRVRVGQDALMSSDAWPGRVIHARVHEVTPSGDPNARAFGAPAARKRGDLPLGITLEVNVVTRSTQRKVGAGYRAFRRSPVW